MNFTGHGSSTSKAMLARTAKNESSSRDFCLVIWGQNDRVRRNSPGSISLGLLLLVIRTTLPARAQPGAKALARAGHSLRLRVSRIRNEPEPCRARRG